MRKTRLYRPQTNGKAEAFVKVVANERAYAVSYASDQEQADMLDRLLREYSLYRPHGGISGQQPISKVHA